MREKLTRGRSNVFLMELILVILFFALSSVVILQLFVSAKEEGDRSRGTTEACRYAQDLAERFKASPGETALALTEEGWSEENDVYTLGLTRDWQPAGNTAPVYLARLTLVRRSVQTGGLMTVQIRISRMNEENGGVLCTLPAAVYLPADESGVAA